MRRIVFLLLTAFMALALIGCGGTSFLGLKDRQAYVLTSPAQIQKVKLSSGATVGAPVLLDAPSGLRSICFRAQSGVLYGLGADKKLYRVNAITGNCVAVSSTALTISDVLGTLYSSATGGKLYYIASDLTTYTISPTSGNVLSTGTALAYASGDANSNPQVGGATFSATGSQLFFVDAANDVLAKNDDPLAGPLHTVGPLGIDVAGGSGMAVDPQLGTFYLVCDAGNPGLYKVDAGTGAVTLISALAGSSIAVIP